MGPKSPEELLLPCRWIEARSAQEVGFGEELVEVVGTLVQDPPAVGSPVAVEKQFEVQRLHGAGNNGVYRLCHAGEVFCLKIYRQDQRARALREVGGMSLLREQGQCMAPRVLWAGLTNQPPFVLMEFLSGQHLGNAWLNRRQLESLAAATSKLHTITSASLDVPLWNLDWDAAERLENLRQQYQALRSQSTTCREATEAVRLAGSWLQGEDPALLAEKGPAVFSRGDQNLANCLWDGTELRIVDLEYCGWNDRALDLANQVEHVQSRGTPGVEWQWFVDQFDLSEAERKRFKAAQRRLALAWLMRECVSPGSLHSIPEGDRIPRLLARAQEVCEG